MGRMIKVLTALGILAFFFAGFQTAGAVELKGDARIRFEHTETTDKPDRDRLRFRLRYGFEADVNETTHVGVRLASGSPQPTSANQTMTDAFSSKALWIDRAYVKYAPGAAYSLTAGKFANPFMRTDMTWSSDVSPEGIVLHANSPAGQFVTLGVLPLAEFSGTTRDPHILALQTGTKLGANARAAAAYYHFNYIKGNTVESISPFAPRRNNTFVENEDGDMVYAYDYRVVDLNLQYNTEVDMGHKVIPLRLFGNYITNIESGVSEDSGMLIGMSAGSVKNRGDIAFSYRYADVDADATAAFLPEDQLRTNQQQHKIGFTYGLSKASNLNLTLYTGSPKTGGGPNVNIWMVNYAVKF